MRTHNHHQSFKGPPTEAGDWPRRLSPTLFFLPALPYGTWTYRSFILHRRATDGLPIWGNTPAIPGVSMALHLFGKWEVEKNHKSWVTGSTVASHAFQSLPSKAERSFHLSLQQPSHTVSLEDGPENTMFSAWLSGATPAIYLGLHAVSLWHLTLNLLHHTQKCPLHVLSICKKFWLVN